MEASSNAAMAIMLLMFFAGMVTTEGKTPRRLTQQENMHTAKMVSTEQAMVTIPVMNTTANNCVSSNLTVTLILERDGTVKYIPNGGDADGDVAPQTIDDAIIIGKAQRKRKKIKGHRKLQEITWYWILTASFGPIQSSPTGAGH